MRRPAPLPSFADLPRFWTAADAQRVFAALDESGLSVGAFARATGLSPTRLGPTYRRRMSARLGVTLGVTLAPVRLVEVVARPELALLSAAAAGGARLLGAAAVGSVPRIQVVTPNGWRLDVPAELLAALVCALGGRPC